MNNLITVLKRLDKNYYTIADLKKITRLPLNSLYVTLARLVKNKSLIRLTSGVYITSENYDKIEIIANTLYQPSYLSFESALSRYGVLSQIPFSLSFATTKKSLRRKLADVSIEYRKIQPPLFFGYEKQESLYIATPEKALLDTLYLVSFGKLIIDLQQLDLK
ncbi:MAG: hypothetical protein Q7U68_02975, partial [Candidatus Roizmanbacteria bacterium]|nr:hypothetical protein [Candidatus Roizmanbacteria bacterium]